MQSILALSETQRFLSRSCTTVLREAPIPAKQSISFALKSINLENISTKRMQLSVNESALIAGTREKMVIAYTQPGIDAIVSDNYEQRPR
ncbi:uncharacterized protein N7487_012319 [Penicillium crustosum]|uniref:uncharacterized protein n=1 Tax=Penicillium crustosum TaxID=36656 RepID=UPI0023A46A60|nr:uncharacterized protein N7487_012319 [Penicillium crustosum]KAJ5394678.1 hypothetical protein N7487_012319 [Penicillium crustosum]